MIELFHIKEGQARCYELDSRVGLNGSKTCWSFPCVSTAQQFFVWLGDLAIESFTRTALLNLTSFAERQGAREIVLVLHRDHFQKGKKHSSNLIPTIVQFQRLFKVLGAGRVSKRGMQELMGTERLDEHVEKYALYRLNLE